MQRMVIAGADDGLTRSLVAALTAGAERSVGTTAADRGHYDAAVLRGADVVVYVPPAWPGANLHPDLSDLRAVLHAVRETRIARLVLVSSAQLYGASPSNPGFLKESHRVSRDARNAVSDAWADYEALARDLLADTTTELTVLRPCPVLAPGRADFFCRLLSGTAAITLAGHDPSLQFLAPRDLAHAIALAAEHASSTVLNVAPDGVVPLHVAMELSQTARVPLLRELQLPVRSLLSTLGIGETPAQLEFLRFPFTISNRRIRAELGFAPKCTSAQALAEFLLARGLHGIDPDQTFDDFGMDEAFFDRSSRRLFDFLAERYFRIEVQGLEHVPDHGRAVLAGVHRGLVAWDGVMVLYVLARRKHRFPRFLVHPTGFRFPFVFDFTTKLGGMPANQDSADYVLEHDELLGIFPEGIRGVFSLYKDAYALRKFGRHDFVKIALRHGAPIIPFVIVGSAETYPIMGKIDWAWWKRKTQWPYFPLTPTLFPLMPLPLPVKWYVRFLPPVDVGTLHAKEAARDSTLVRELSDRVKASMQHAMDELAAARKSIFFG